MRRVGARRIFSRAFLRRGATRFVQVEVFRACAVATSVLVVTNINDSLPLMIARQHRAGGGSDDQPLCRGASSCPECAARGGDGGVSLGGGGREFCRFVGKVAL